MAVLAILTGTDWHQPFSYIDAQGAAVSLTGATGLTFVIYRPPAAVLYTLAVGSGITVTSAAAGEIKVSLTAAQTQSQEGEYLYETYCILASGDTVILDAGNVLFRETFIGV